MCIFIVILWIMYFREFFIIIEDELINYRIEYFYFIGYCGCSVLSILVIDDIILMISCIRDNDGKFKKFFGEVIVFICDIDIFLV